MSNKKWSHWQSLNLLVNIALILGIKALSLADKNTNY